MVVSTMQVYVSEMKLEVRIIVDTVFGNIVKPLYLTEGPTGTCNTDFSKTRFSYDKLCVCQWSYVITKEGRRLQYYLESTDFCTMLRELQEARRA